VTDLRQVFDDLVRFETILWSIVDECLRKECDVTLASLNVLLIIDATPQCRVLDIAQALAITVGGTSQAVDRLEAAGWAVRKANPTDRRSSIVELTPEGAALATRAKPVFDRQLERLLRTPLPSIALVDLGTTLGILRRSAAGRADTVTPPI
jgi:MarR family transcriptional regulator, organic hydroperoxide resistance regulator